MKKVASVFVYLVIALLMLTAAFTFIAPHIGWRVDVVLSGSMEPKLHTGGLVVTRPVLVDTIQTGDIITFYSPVTHQLTTHRVVTVIPGSPPSFHTRGDANEDADIVSITADSIVGEVCFDVPYIGYVTRFVKTPLGLLITLCLPGVLIVITETKNIRRALLEREIV